ncbi:MAG: transposase [Pseudobutyrivibrio sp.]|nr:transposase [Pseudobutyrivibrio sp.]
MPRTKRTFSPEFKAKLTNWANLIREQQESSMNVTKFCEAHSISKSQFYYWRRHLRLSFIQSH